MNPQINETFDLRTDDAQLVLLDTRHCEECVRSSAVTHPGTTKCWFHKRGDSHYFCATHKKVWPLSDVTQAELDYRMTQQPNGRWG